MTAVLSLFIKLSKADLKSFVWQYTACKVCPPTGLSISVMWHLTCKLHVG